MNKVLLYGINGEKSCFLHVLLNAAQLHEAGLEVKVIFEGASVRLVKVFEEENNPVYRAVKDAGLIAGICLACAKTLGVYEDAAKSGLPFLSDMNGHAGMKQYVLHGYQVVSI